jgi:hypothetical protein
VLEKKCYNEIVEQHSFFQDWFNGKIEKNEKTFQRFPSVLDNKFELITPSLQKYAREDILQLVWNSHASRTISDNPMKIWIENFGFKQLTSDIFLVTYEEWQKVESEDKGRLSTAIFLKKENKFNGIVWIHVHETWLPEKISNNS